MSRIVLKNVSKSFGKTEVIKNLTLEIEEKEFIVFVGPSGCGKSTLLRLIAGLEEIDKGELYIDNILYNNIHPSQRKIAMVFQSYALYPHMNVEENLGFSLKNFKTSPASIALKTKKTAEKLQIHNLLHRYPRELSGGQKQRVAIGRSIIRNPKVFLFDEPLSNLDSALRIRMRLEIAKLHKELKNTTIYVTHDQLEAMTLASKIVILNNGNIEQVGSPLEVYHYPSNLFVARFIGSPHMNIVKISDFLVKNDRLIIYLPKKQQLKLQLKKKVAPKKILLGIRPHDFYCTKKNFFLEGVMNAVENLGNELYGYFDSKQTPPLFGELFCINESFRAKLPPLEKDAKFYFDAESCYVFDENKNCICNGKLN